MKYNNWTYAKRISIVYAVNKTITINNIDYPKAYIVDSSNKNQMNAAIRWATEHTKDISPLVINTDNEDFKFSLATAAFGSNQGGKVSFWMCIMSKNDIKPFAVGINSDLLLTLLLNSTFVRGVCNKKVFFARQNSQLGVLHKDMDEYKELLKDIEAKAEINKHKTTKWKIGYSYNTLTQSDVLLGYYTPIVTSSISQYWGDTITGNITVNLDAKPIPIVSYVRTDNDLDKYIQYNFWDFKVNFYHKSTLPARQEGSKLFNINEKLIASKLTLPNRSMEPVDIFNIITVAFSVYKIDPTVTIKILKKLYDIVCVDIQLLSESNLPTVFNLHLNSNNLSKIWKKQLINAPIAVNADIVNGERITFSRFDELVKFFLDLSKGEINNG